MACLVVSLNIALNIILRKYMGARGLALATSISSYIGLAVMLILLRKRMGGLGLRHIAGELIKILIAALGCAAVCVVMNRILPEANGTIATFARLAAATAAGFTVYLAACLLLRVQALKGLAAEITGRIRK